MANTANYAVVMAQLYTKGKCEGIHPFMVQLRDENTHEPLPGNFLRFYITMNLIHEYPYEYLIGVNVIWFLFKEFR